LAFLGFGMRRTARGLIRVSPTIIRTLPRLPPTRVEGSP
jgi:hypothetical protein